MILNLISGPRNLSTALMYSFAQRSDTQVWDEPFYAVYLSRTAVPHPGADAVLKALSADEDQVRAEIRARQERPLQFIKNMAHHMEVLREPILPEATNVFLIRDPAQILASYAEVISKPVMRDIGIAYQSLIFDKLRSHGKRPLVIDSGHLLQDPRGVLTALCDACGLAYDQRMEHWSAGPKPYDGVWASHWYKNVHQSTGFEKQSSSSRPLLPHLKDLLEEALLYYEKLLPFSLKA